MRYAGTQRCGFIRIEGCLSTSISELEDRINEIPIGQDCGEISVSIIQKRGVNRFQTITPDSPELVDFYGKTSCGNLILVLDAFASVLYSPGSMATAPPPFATRCAVKSCASSSGL